MYGVGTRTRRPRHLVVYVRYWSRHQRDPWPFDNVREFTKSTTANTNRSLVGVHRTTATPKQISSHLPRHSPLSFTTNCVSAARPTRRRRAQSDLVSISRFFENGTQQLPNMLEQYILRSLRWSGLTRMPYETGNCRFIELASQPNEHSSMFNGDGYWRCMRLSLGRSLAHSLGGATSGCTSRLCFQIMFRVRRWWGAAIIRS